MRRWRILGVNNRILIADDEVDVLNMVASNLSSAGFHVLKAEDGPSAIAAARRDAPALIVLDLMMPGMSGLEVCRVLKAEIATSSISILLLSARAEEVDRIIGFELGADDYVTKPFSARELVLRVKSILRRKMVSRSTSSVLSLGDITVDQERHYIAVRGVPIDLTVIEFKLMVALLESPGCVLSREDLLARVWGVENNIESRTVDTHMRRLREKLDKAGKQIHTVRGFGYRLDE